MESPRPIRFLLPILIATFLLYLPVIPSGFLGIDDDIYVSANPQVLAGLSAAGIQWAFSAMINFYHPLTWISLMADSSISTNPNIYHLTNLWLHIANGVLCFRLLQSLRLSLSHAAVVTALFALHPVNTESVAWIAERKGLLAATFALASLNAFVQWTRSPRASLFWLSWLLYLASLLSKTVTLLLPLLLAFQLWTERPIHIPQRPLRSQILSLLPFFLLSGLFGILTPMAQKGVGALHESAISWESIAASFENIFHYVVAFIAPVNLAIFVPRSPSVSFPSVAAGIAALLGCAWCARKELRSGQPPWITWSVLLFLVFLIPVVGIVQIGSAQIAYRYLYLPSIGLALGITTAVARLAPNQFLQRFNVAHPRHRNALLYACIALFGLATWNQLRYWRTPYTLFQHSARIHPCANNFNALGAAAARDSKLDVARENFQRAVQLDPSNSYALLNLAQISRADGRSLESVQFLERAANSDAYNIHAFAELALLRAAHPSDEIRDIAKARQAIANATRAVQANPPNLRFLYAQSVAALLDRDYPRAAESCANAQRLAGASGNQSELLKLQTLQKHIRGKAPWVDFDLL